MTHDHLPLVRLGQGDYVRDYPGDEPDPVIDDGRDVLTATRLATLRRCPRQHHYRYELGLTRNRTATPLRFGAAFHRGLELHGKGVDEDLAIVEAISGYANVPIHEDPVAWSVERESVAALLAGHFASFPRTDDINFIEVEQTFSLPLTNPATGRCSRTFTLAGKIDGLVRLSDGRVAVLEYKTAGEDIGPDAAYWLRLRIDPQISLYVLAARELGYDVSTVVYDVTRKPTIRLRKGETPEQYGQRLREDIHSRPDFYFARREIPRLEDDLAEVRAVLWQQARQLAEARRHGRWFRNAGRFTCDHCPFADLCLQSITVDPDGPPPSGYRVLSHVHPELVEGASR